MNTNIPPTTEDSKEILKKKILAQWSSDRQDIKTVIIFFLLALFLTGVGIVVAIYSSQVTSYTSQYSGTVECTNSSLCTIDIHIDDKLEAPVYFWYELQRFYQNQRQYVLSSDINELDGDVSNYDICYPIFTNEEANRTVSVFGDYLIPSDPVIPCGVASNTLFNDTYLMRNSKGQEIYLNQTDITWESRDHGIELNEIDQPLQWVNVTNETFLVWIRLAPMSSFKKVYGRIDEDLEPGVYTVTIENNFDMYGVFGSKKGIRIGTVNVFGDKNILLDCLYLSFALVCWGIAIGFLIKVIIERRKKKRKQSNN